MLRKVSLWKRNCPIKAGIGVLMKRSFLILVFALAAIAAPALASLGVSSASSGMPILQRSFNTILLSAWISVVRLEQAVRMPEAVSLFLMGSGLLVGAIYLRKRLLQGNE
jgi:hypothetical protein